MGNSNYTIKKLPDGNSEITYDKNDPNRKYDTYVGQISCNVPHGQGKMTYANGDVYEGQWNVKGLIGQCKITYTNGNIYEGNYAYWRGYTKGKMTYTNGNIYEGHWEKNIPHGTGVLKCINGNIYEGEWQHGKKNNMFHVTLPNGEVQIQHWFKDALIKTQEVETAHNTSNIYLNKTPINNVVNTSIPSAPPSSEIVFPSVPTKPVPLVKEDEIEGEREIKIIEPGEPMLI